MHCWPTVCSRGAKDTLPGACPWSSQPLGGPRKGEGDMPWASHLLLGARILDQTQSGIQPSCCNPGFLSAPRAPTALGPAGPGEGPGARAGFQTLDCGMASTDLLISLSSPGMWPTPSLPHFHWGCLAVSPGSARALMVLRQDITHGQRKWDGNGGRENKEERC